MAITIDGTNGLTTDNAALKLDGTTLSVDDTNNRVGIGTASPSGKLTVANGDVRIDTDDNGVIWGNNGIFGNNASDYVYVETQDTERMRVDSDGRVTMPYQTSFRAYKTSSTTTNGTVVNWQGTFHNTGNNFNQSTGVFTAPITGNYLVSIYFLTENNTSPVDGLVRLNGAPNDGIRTRSGTSSGHKTTGATAVIRMAANDTLDVYKENVGTFYGDASKTWSSFSVHLLG